MSGGGSVISSEIVDSLSKQGHNVFVIVPKINWKEARFEPVLDSKIKIIRVKTPLENNIKFAARLCKNNLEKEIEIVCKNNNIELIFSIFHPFHRVPHAAVKVGRKLKIPTLIKVDDAIYAKSSRVKSLQRKIENISNRKILQNTDKIFVVNESVKKIIINEYKIREDRISVIPNGIDIKKFEKKIKNEQTFTVIFSGVMYYHRGLDILLDSISKVVLKIPNIKVVLLGDGPEMEKLKEISQKRNLRKNIKFKGWIDRNNIPNYLAGSSIGIGPLMLTEVTKNALPIKVLEYMASSLPIIARTGTLSNDILKEGKNGFFINDSEDLAAKLELLASEEKLLTKMGKESFNMVQKFDWTNITSIILDEYKKIKNNNS
jgi:glycosyltransferase involved in cell wall biosynthesis